MRVIVIRNLSTCASWRLGLASFIAIMILIVAPAHSEIPGCKFVVSGFGFLGVIAKGGEKFVYRLESLDAHWPLEGIGYHANAAVHCKDCDPSDALKGLIWFGAQTAPLERPISQLLVESANKKKAFTWYELRHDSARALGEPDAISLGRMTGWVTRYETSIGDIPDHDVVEAELGDGCVVLVMTLYTWPSRTIGRLGVVEDLFRSLKVTRTPADQDPEGQSLEKGGWFDSSVTGEHKGFSPTSEELRRALDALQ